ncbi:MAG: DUF2911 domain-containing protein [Cyanobacteria bacterium REEB67]|nr:DUF2911 domain-containing protein [Cyanobacteria bacterium REEB67]
MNFKTITLTLALGCGLMVNSGALAQTKKVEFPAASPACSIKQHVGLTDISIDYSRPSVKGRQIFGDVVPYDKVWRTGANQATKLVFSTPVKLNGTEIPAGTYALMTIPGKDQWTIIINKGSEQWGAYKYDQKADVARFKVTPVQIDRPIDTFTIEFNEIRDDSSLINLAWDKTVVPIKLEVSYVDKLLSEIKDVMASDAKEKPYFQSALFYFNHGQDLEQAKKWVDAALVERDAFYIAYLKAQILAKLGDKPGALAASKHSTELAEKANDPAYVRLNQVLQSGLQ